MSFTEGNKLAEKWTLKEATDLFNKAIVMSCDEKYDFVGEIARDLKIYRTLFDYLKEKFPDELTVFYNQLMGNLEASCFEHSKKGKIREATAIVNLKSNYGWTDRVQQGHSGSITIDFTND